MPNRPQRKRLVPPLTCNHDRSKRFGKTKGGEQRYRCLDCGKTFVESTRTLDGMRIGTDKAAQIVQCVMEGVGVRGTARLAGVCKDTVLDVLVLVGQRCQRFSEGTIRRVPAKQLQVDELWSFVGCKERTRKQLSYPAGSCGDQYCFVGLDASTKLVLAWYMGDRTHESGVTFIRKLMVACQPEQISSDAWRPYTHLIPNHFRRADYGQVIKIYGKPQDETRYSPAQIIEVKKRVIAGNPDESTLNTSYVERNNLSIRMGLRRFTRLTNGFSRKLENHEAALGLYFCHYNFCQRHGTLKTSPAVASGLETDRWSVAELIERTANYTDKSASGDEWVRFLGTIPDGE